MEQRKGKNIIIFGIGSMGGWVLEFLARSKGIDTIIVADTNENYGRIKVENVAIGAAWAGYFKKIKFRKIDVFDVDRTAEFIKMANPSNQSPNIVSSFDDICASTIPLIICSAVNTNLALNKYGFFRLSTWDNFNLLRLCKRFW